MKLLSFEVDNRPRLGLLDEGRVLDISSARPDDPAFGSMLSLIEAGDDKLDELRALAASPDNAQSYAFGDVKLLGPLPDPPRLRDCSLFLEHMQKSLTKWAQSLAKQASDPAAELKTLLATGKFDMNPAFRDRILYYNADAGSISAPGEDILWPTDSDWMDYELEWACVIGRGGSNISKAAAKDHIFGYTILNDWSARDTQLVVMACNLGPGEGKDFQGGYTLGPVIVTRDELPDPYALTMIARVNGEEWSRGSTSTMHHRFEDAVAYLSRDRTLRPGEVLGSGTVLNGCGFELDRRLSDGDLVELEVEGIGVLANRVKRQAMTQSPPG